MVAALDRSRAALPEIPVIDIGGAGPLELVRRARRQAEALLAGARRQFTGILVDLADRRARRWLADARNPYLAEIDAVAAELGRRGAHGLNLSYEWGCTTGICADGDGGMVMRRTLDWPYHGLGRNLVVAKRDSPAGAWLDLTWPGFVGVFTALAPGRFAAGINQAPLRRRTGVLALDWLADRIGVGRSTALPPSHLLRQVFESCRSYGEAEAALASTPICVPALFILSGAAAGEGCIIERTEDRAELHRPPAAAANHWLSARFGRAKPRGIDSRGRQARLAAALADERANGDLAWVTPPIANAYTRLAAVLDAGSGRLCVQGWERDGPATQVLRL
jgi:hypothetical protein